LTNLIGFIIYRITSFIGSLQRSGLDANSSLTFVLFNRGLDDVMKIKFKEVSIKVNIVCALVSDAFDSKSEESYTKGKRCERKKKF